MKVALAALLVTALFTLAGSSSRPVCVFPRDENPEWVTFRYGPPGHVRYWREYVNTEIEDIRVCDL